MRRIKKSSSSCHALGEPARIKDRIMNRRHMFLPGNIFAGNLQWEAKLSTARTSCRPGSYSEVDLGVPDKY